ncbi:hypothetical protein F5Y03DRAFT_117328 [Xylaria venustula]|nr:hypothetical protein F5Y03DRAFT_117328 [Xylaria venustula]
METISIFCSQCDHRIGALLNSWTQIGKGYISPVIQAGAALDVSHQGTVQDGEKGTIVEKCRLQGLACSHCHSKLGSECLSSAINHVLHEGSLLLRTSSIQIKGSSSHVLIQPIIQRVLRLKNPPIRESQNNDRGSPLFEDDEEAADENPRFSDILDQINTQGEKLEQLDAAGYQIVASFNQSVQHMDEAIRDLKKDTAQVTQGMADNSTKTKELANDILSTKTEIENIKRDLQPLDAKSHLEKERCSIRNAVAEANASLLVEFSGTWERCQKKLDVLGSELESMQKNLRGFRTMLEDAHITAKAAWSASNANTEKTAALETELEALKQELVLERSYKPPSANPVLTSHEVDILTSNITKIGHRASHVETLQMEFELLKGRVQRIEAQTPTWQRDPTSALRQQETRYSHSVIQKPVPSPESHMSIDSENINSTPTVLSISGNKVSRPSPATPLNSPTSATAPGDVPEAKVKRLTRSGAVDKRCLKKTNSKRAPSVRKGSKR